MARRAKPDTRGVWTVQVTRVLFASTLYLKGTAPEVELVVNEDYLLSRLTVENYIGVNKRGWATRATILELFTISCKSILAR